MLFLAVVIGAWLANVSFPLTAASSPAVPAAAAYARLQMS